MKQHNKEHTAYRIGCKICGKNCLDDELNDYYMLKDEVWKEICEKGKRSWYDILCRDCAEKILNRKLTEFDLADVPLNDDIKPHWRIV